MQASIAVSNTVTMEVNALNDSRILPSQRKMKPAHWYGHESLFHYICVYYWGNVAGALLAYRLRLAKADLR